jgi:glucokinase
MFLAGDVGGTKTDLAVFSPVGGPRAPLVEATFPSADYPSLEAVVREFLGRVDQAVERAAFGVAGPVVGGQARITNLPWVIDAAQLQKALDFSAVWLLNDLEAIANAVPFLQADDLDTLNDGEPVAGGPVAVIAPGTGLGEAYLAWDGMRYRAYASEGGHAGFAPIDPLQIDLLRYLQDRFGHVSWERVCSGQGISNIYAFLMDSGRADEPDWLAERLAAVDDPAPAISSIALDAAISCEICIATLDIFVAILGAEAGNMALKVLATGGVYLGGGIPPRILPALKQGGFMEAFQHKGRMSDLMARIPVRIILNPKAALLGAASYGLELWRDA